MLGFLKARIRQINLPAFFIKEVISGAVFDGLTVELSRQAVELEVKVGRVVGMPRNNERCACFINKNGVHLINDGVVQATLHAVSLFRDHVVAQVVKAKLVIGAVGNVAGIGLLLRVVIELGEVNTGSQAKGGIKPSHPLGITGGQVIVHGHHVNTLTFKCIQISRKGCHQGLALAGAHLGDLALVQNHATQKLDIKMTHA